MSSPQPWLTFTHDGCRSELRVGVLLCLLAVFVWLWLGPDIGTTIGLFGVPLVLVGTVLQVYDAGRGRPGFPGRLAVVMACFGLVMLFDLRYQQDVGTAIRWHTMPWLMLIPGLWMVAAWPLARHRSQRFAAASAA